MKHLWYSSRKSNFVVCFNAVLPLIIYVAIGILFIVLSAAVTCAVVVKLSGERCDDNNDDILRHTFPVAVSF